MSAPVTPSDEFDDFSVIDTPTRSLSLSLGTASPVAIVDMTDHFHHVIVSNHNTPVPQTGSTHSLSNLSDQYDMVEVSTNDDSSSSSLNSVRPAVPTPIDITAERLHSMSSFTEPVPSQIASNTDILSSDNGTPCSTVSTDNGTVERIISMTKPHSATSTPDTMDSSVPSLSTINAELVSCVATHKTKEELEFLLPAEKSARKSGKRSKIRNRQYQHFMADKSFKRMNCCRGVLCLQTVEEEDDLSGIRSIVAGASWAVDVVTRAVDRCFGDASNTHIETERSGETMYEEHMMK